jgi:hypothetical protein
MMDPLIYFNDTIINISPSMSCGVIYTFHREIMEEYDRQAM